MLGKTPEAHFSINNRPEFTYFPAVSEIPLSGKTAVSWMLNSALVGNDISSTAYTIQSFSFQKLSFKVIYKAKDKEILCIGAVSIIPTLRAITPSNQSPLQPVQLENKHAGHARKGSLEHQRNDASNRNRPLSIT